MIIHTETQQGYIAEVGFKHTVQRIFVLFVPIPEAVAFLMGRHETSAQCSTLCQRTRNIHFATVGIPRANALLHMRLKLTGGTFTDQVDYTAGATCPRHQSRGASYNLDMVVYDGVQQCAGHGAGFVNLSGRDTVYLIGIDCRTTRIDVVTPPAILGHGHTRCLVQYAGDTVELLVLYALASNNANRLGRLSNRKIHLRRRTGRPRRVGPRPLRGSAQSHRIDAGRTQFQCSV
ncbi:hypothetical protein D3C81_1111380 [compost metagenome]